MAILVAESLSKYFAAQDLFSDLSFEVNHGDKIALIGPNGVGKTTLLRILCGLEAPDSGSVTRAKNLRIGYLPQQATFASEQKLYQELLEIFQPLQAQRAELRHMEEKMSREATPELLERYGKALERFELEGGYEYELRIQRVLNGLGFAPEDFDKPIAILSGGQKTRALLAKLLLQDPQFLLLDEPTNHLDLSAIEWLEKYLQEWPQSLIVVSHDRYFLDTVANRVWELSFGRLDQYNGNYSHYLEQRADRVARRWTEYERQQEMIAKTEDFIRRYKAGQRSKEARGRLRRLERMERVERPQEERKLHLALKAAFRSGNDVLMTDDLVVGFPADATSGAHVLFTAGDLLLRRQQRVALLGPNGSGKTTFLKTILGQIAPLAGTIRLGGSVKVGYFAQGHEDLNLENTVLEEILSVKNLPLAEARNFLARFLFTGDDVFKPLSALSGGERGRIALAKLTLRGANLLLLDEPTNYLDIASQEILEQVLLDFNGTILFVSHDRYFIDAIATHMWVIADGKLRSYKGNYSDYVEQRAQEEAEALAAAVCAPEAKREPQRDAVARPNRYEERKRARQALELEEAISRLEHRLSELEAALTDASAAQEMERVRELGLAYAAAEEELYEKLAIWAEIGQAQS